MKLKSLIYLLSHDKNKILTKYFFRNFFSLSTRFIISLFKTTYTKKDGIYLFNIIDPEYIKKSSNLIIGFSFCEKPLECPSQRFTSECKNDPLNTICQTCPISKYLKKINVKDYTIFFITTVNYIGEELIKIKNTNPNFLIIACPFSLKMFAHFSYILNLKGIGIPLEGPVCNNFKAFKLAEEGKKKAKTFISNQLEEKLFFLCKKKI